MGYSAIALEVSDGARGKGSDSRGRKYSVWVMTAPLCAMQYIGDPWYLQGDREGTETGGIGAKKPNGQLRPSKTVSRRGFKKHELLRGVALRSIQVKEKLFCGLQ